MCTQELIGGIEIDLIPDLKYPILELELIFESHP